MDWALVDRARQLAGLKGYVTNIPGSTMGGQAVISAYHDLWQVERSFRMARPTCEPDRCSTGNGTPSKRT